MFNEVLNAHPNAHVMFDATNITGAQNWLAQTQLFLGLAQLAIFLLAGLTQLRKPIIHRLYWFALLAQLLLWPAMAYLWLGIPRILMNQAGTPFNASDRTDFLIDYFWLFLLVFALQIVWALLLGLRETINLYWGTHSDAPEIADRILEDVRTNGRQPLMRKSAYLAVLAHLLIVLIVPWLMTARGCVEPYSLPGPDTGDDKPIGPTITRIPKPQESKKRRVLVNPHAAILFTPPSIGDELIDEVGRATEDPNQAHTEEAKGDGQNGHPGAPGGGKGGWPSNMGKVRFIRLAYNGGQDWDQDMGEGADYNFLLKIREITGFKTADHTESIAINRLDNFPRNQAPPFVYMTGGTTSGTISLSSEECKVLRNYLLKEGGMIFADAGGNRFDRPFRAMLKSVLPELDLVVIPHDDEIYRTPNSFPNGSPPLWHHAGNDAYGLKDDTGRWIVFYHPGDINDAWKTGHSGAPKYAADQAYKMGINVVAYAFRNYRRLHPNGK